jgi:hypothetical protein
VGPGRSSLHEARRRRGRVRGTTFGAHEVIIREYERFRRRLGSRRHGDRPCDREPGRNPWVVGGRLRGLLEPRRERFPAGRAVGSTPRVRRSSWCGGVRRSSRAAPSVASYGGSCAEGLVVDDTVRCLWHHACVSLRTVGRVSPYLHVILVDRPHQRRHSGRA